MLAQLQDHRNGSGAHAVTTPAGRRWCVPPARSLFLLAVGSTVLIAGCRGAGRAASTPAVVPSDSAGRAVTPDSVAARAPVTVAPTDSTPRPGRDSAKVPAATDSTGARPPKTDSVPKKPAKKAPPPSRPCVLDMTESPPETRLLYSRMSETVSNTFIGGGFVGRCQGENNRLRADSAEQFQAAGIVNLYGNVVYEEPNKVQITAMHATYFTREGRLYADGNVVATQLATGSTFAGPSIEYFRATPERPASRLIAPSRSTARLIEKDSTGRLQPPTTVIANRFEDAGDSLLMAWGDVRIDREQLQAQADSASFDKITEQSRLVRGARIVNRDTAQQFTLVGDTIDMYSTARKLDRVVARHKSTATSDDLVLNAEIIDVRLKDQQLEEAFAFGSGRAKATTPQQDVIADSLRIRLVDKQVREVRAVGSAVAVGTPDTLKIRTTDKDLLRGDSIFAFFDSIAVRPPVAAPAPGATTPRDTGNRVSIKEIRAMGNASSLFHMATSKGPTAPPAINYVRGLRIFVNFDTGTVRDVRVDSAASGLYLEPASDSLADTAAAPGPRRRRPPGRPGGAPVPTGSPARRPPGEDDVTAPAALPPLASATRRRP